MTVSLTSNFFSNARGLTLLDTASVVWSFNKNTNQITAVATATGGPTGANPTAKVGLTTVNGSATTFMRSDGAPPIDLTLVPTWTGAHTFSAAVTLNGAVTVNGTAGASCIIIVPSSGNDGITVNAASQNGVIRVNNSTSGNAQLTLTTSGVVEWDIVNNRSAVGTLQFVAGGTAVAQIGTAGTISGTNHTSTGVATAAAAGAVNYGGTTATTATAGGLAAVPATVAGYVIVNVAGTARKIPYFAT